MRQIMFQKNKETKEDLDILARRSIDKIAEIETRISPQIRLTGDIEGKENVKLEGSFEGKAHITGLFYVGSTGKFKGELSSDNVIVEGEFEGSVIQAKKIELRSSSKFKGNIVSNTVAIAEGSFFEGEIKMAGNGKGQQFSFEEKRKIKTENGMS
jgi:cytoskeletal protein CcmA (bactofilin family)